MKDPRQPSDPKPDRTAGRSADARGETGTDADRVGSRTRGLEPGDVGGIPAAADAGLANRKGEPGRQTAMPPVDRSQVKQDSRGPASSPQRPAGAQPARPDDEREDAGPLESLGRAISAPVRGAADDDQAPGQEGGPPPGRSKP